MLRRVTGNTLRDHKRSKNIKDQRKIQKMGEKPQRKM